MAKGFIEDTTLTAIANAIRTKGGTSAAMLPSEMATLIETIDSRDIMKLVDRTITNIELPDGLTSIGSGAFSNCTNLALTSLPDSLTSIGSGAFSDCTNLTELTFKGKPASIGSYAFGGCTNLKVINVPWSSGEVSGAPWGATNATINYNYVAEGV